jgi:hypothetical protein
MSITKQEAAVARAQAAKTTEAKDRLSALEVERQGYVQRGDKKGQKAIDDEIAHWSKVAGIPVESGTVTASGTPAQSADGADQVQQLEQELAEARADIATRDAELAELRTLAQTHAGTVDDLNEARQHIEQLQAELDTLKATPTAETPTPAAPSSGGRAKAAAAAKG